MQSGTKYVLVSGGVVSGLGKGVTASSVGVLLKGCGYRVTSIKIGAQLPGRRAGALQCGAAADSRVRLLRRSLPQCGRWYDVPF